MKRHFMYTDATRTMCGKTWNLKTARKWRRLFQCRACSEALLAAHNEASTEANERGQRLEAIERELYR